jgi:acetyl esterase/lipase
MGEYLRRENRRDTKWAHPQALGGINWLVPGLLDSAYTKHEEGPEKVAAERIEERETMLNMYMENEKEKRKLEGDWSFAKAHGCPEEPDTPTDLVIRTPKRATPDEKLPCILDIQGGGLYAGGAPEYFMAPTASMSKHHHAVVVSPTYRLAVEAEYPACINDVHAAYIYILEHVDELGIDPKKIIIHGFSSGAHLSLCLGFRLKRYGIKPRGIVASLPVVDDTNDTQSGTFSFMDPKTGSIDAWDGEGNITIMHWWLGKLFGSPHLPPEAVANRATVKDCIGYPPTWIPIIAEMDAARDSTLEFCRKLHAANVFVDYHVWAGCNHNTTDPTTPLGKLMAQGDEFAIDQAIEFDFSRPWTEE